ncbi:helix-turn-helix domain-containing protein [Nocardiopsis salina]|uniref:helix-turn-helix domain-containing protein n=1 Tax=Nocardiopsis salina TaxID=245836 RepID=UPI000347A3A5|nr:helix-turn-helix domain-containing protein [Nocardiopsis salina]
MSRAPERIPGLVKQVLSRADPHGRHTLTPAALQAFVQWSWPGNLAELSDTIAAVVGDAQAPLIQRRHLPQHLRQAPPRRRLTPLETAEREAIIRALSTAEGNKSEAAAALGIGRTTLYRRLRRLGIDADERFL